jgi:hypothetical protein
MILNLAMTVTPPSPASRSSTPWDDNSDLIARGSDPFSWDYADRSSLRSAMELANTNGGS